IYNALNLEVKTLCEFMKEFQGKYA
ncbi:hypothetical protein OLQ94_06650, partial [Campylobacter jejuni]|nr:hypothetical protein [Campylobacter jejuni]